MSKKAQDYWNGVLGAQKDEDSVEIRDHRLFGGFVTSSELASKFVNEFTPLDSEEEKDLLLEIQAAEKELDS